VHGADGERGEELDEGWVLGVEAEVAGVLHEGGVGVVGFVPGGGVGAGKEGELEGDEGEEDGDGDVRALEVHR
jgi:hypothetical protein